MQAVSREQMAELDRLAETMGVGTAELMERAGERIAELAEKMAGGKNIAVLCGHGNNGGDGLCAARKLAARGFSVTVFLASPREKYSGEPRNQLERAERAGIRVVEANEKAGFATFDLLIDALLGFNLSGAPRGKFAELIRAANASGKPILAVDLPSGLDANSGEAFEPCIKAAATVTLAYPKIGLLEEKARGFVGRLFLADIGMPAGACIRAGLKPIAFSSKLVELTRAARPQSR
ncbi:MAG: NAD(P)H-hydrate epimerase [Candidatus Micrarchaeia archaeon]